MELRFSEDGCALCLSEKIDDKSLETLMKLGFSDRYPNEFATWERGRMEIMRRFREICTQEQKDMHTTLEGDLGGIKVGLREAVTIEVLEAFP
jgi:hypothetical protein